MTAWSRLRGALGLGKADDSAEHPFLLGQDYAWASTTSGVPVTSFTALQHVAVMACVSILAEDIAKLPLQVYRRLPNGGKEPAKDHFLYRLLRRPNPWQTRFEFVEMMQAAVVLRGNAYAPILRDERGIPRSLVPVHPDRVSIYEAPDGDVFYFVTRNGLHETAVLKSLPLMIHADDMLHVRWMAGWSSLVGLSRIGLMREAVGLSMSQEQHAAGLMGRGARPSGVLQTDQVLGKESYENVKRSWQENYGGVRNAGRVAVLEQGLKWEPLTMTMVDAEFIEQRKLQIIEIARGFRVPPHKLGIETAGAESSMVQMDQEYLNSVLSSYCDRWKSKVEQAMDLDGDEIFVEFDYEHFLKADIQTRLTALRTGVVGMIYTPNEARGSLGLPKVEGGDVLYQPTNVAPIGFTPSAAKPNGPGSDVSGEPAQGGDGDPTAIPGDQPAQTNALDEAPHLRLVGEEN